MPTNKKAIALSPIIDILKYALQDKNNSNSQIFCPEVKNTSFKISENAEVDLILKTILSTEEMMKFVSDVSKNLFINEDYHPENYNIVFAWSVLNYYTNIDIKAVSASQINQLVYQTDIINTILIKVNQRQLLDIKNAVKQVVKFKQQSILNEQHIALEKITMQLAACADIMGNIFKQTEGIDLRKLSESTIALAQKDEDTLSQGILKYHNNKNIGE